MNIEFTDQDIEVIRESLKYSKERISSAKGTPDNVRQENLGRIERVLLKLSRKNE